jgi:hypothetical protein
MDGRTAGGTGLAVACAASLESEEGRIAMRMRNTEEGKIGWVILWLLGIPIPVLLVLFLLRGCT